MEQAVAVGRMLSKRRPDRRCFCSGYPVLTRRCCEAGRSRKSTLRVAHVQARVQRWDERQRIIVGNSVCADVTGRCVCHEATAELPLNATIGTQKECVIRGSLIDRISIETRVEAACGEIGR